MKGLYHSLKSLQGLSKEEVGSLLIGDRISSGQGSWLKVSLPTPVAYRHSLGDGGVSGEAPVYVHGMTQLIDPNDLQRSRFLGFLGQYFDDEARFYVEGCGKEFFKLWCHEGKHWVLRPISCGKRRICPICADRYAWSKVNHAFDVFREIEEKTKFKVYVMHSVFTLPDFLWDGVKGNENRFFKIVYRVLKRLSRGMSGGVSAFHMWRSSDPLSGYYPHIHVVIPNIVFFKNGELWYFKRTKPYFDLDKAKKIYREELKKEFGQSIDEVNLWVRYMPMKHENRIKRVLKYIFRSPISDFSKDLRSDLGSEIVKFVINSIYFKKKRIRWFGFLADGVKTKYLSYLGIRYTIFDEYRKNRENLCPIHGFPLEYMGKISVKGLIGNGG